MLDAQDEITLGKSTRDAATGIAQSQKYDAAQIDKLEGLEAVRKRVRAARTANIQRPS